MDLIGNRFQFCFFLLLFFLLWHNKKERNNYCNDDCDRNFVLFFFRCWNSSKSQVKTISKKNQEEEVVMWSVTLLVDLLEKLVSGFFSQSHWSSFRLEWIFECFTLGKKTNHSRIVLLQLERFNSSTIPWVLRHYQNKIWQFDLFCLLVGRFTWNENSTDCMCGNGVFTWFK